MTDFLQTVLHFIRSPGPLIEWAGYPGLALIIFLETGALVFFLPGDSLLVTAGLYAFKGDLSLPLLNALLIPAAILGDATSYTLGAKLGPAVLQGRASRFVRAEHLAAAKSFYQRHGGKAIILARFMPLVRTFVPVVAGVAQMPYRRFAMFNVVGAFAWVSSMTLTGYFLASLVPDIGKHIEKVILLIVFLSLLPGIVAWWKRRNAMVASQAPR